MQLSDPFVNNKSLSIVRFSIDWFDIKIRFSAAWFPCFHLISLKMTGIWNEKEVLMNAIISTAHCLKKKSRFYFTPSFHILSLSVELKYWFAHNLLTDFSSLLKCDYKTTWRKMHHTKMLKKELRVISVMRIGIPGRP